MADDAYVADAPAQDEQAPPPVAVPPPMPGAPPPLQFELKEPPHHSAFTTMLWGKHFRAADQEFYRQQDLQLRLAEHQQEQEQQAFWKQTEFAKYLQSHRETLSHDYDAATQVYLKASEDWSKSNMALNAAKLSGLPLDNFAQDLALKQEALGFAKARIQRATSGMDSADQMMPAIIANLSPPSMAGKKGGKAGQAGEAPQPATGEPTAIPGQEDAQMGPALPPATIQQRTMQDFEAAGGFPEGKVVNGMVHYEARNKEEKDAMEKRAQAIASANGISYPYTIEDRSIRLKNSLDSYQWNATQARMETAKGDFWRNLEQTNPKTAELQAMLTAAGPNDERAGVLAGLINMTEAQRKVKMRELAKGHEDNVLQYQRDMATLRPNVEQWNRDQLGEAGIRVIEPEKAASATFELGSAPPPAMTDTEFRDYYIALKNQEIMHYGRPGQSKWDPKNPQDWQRQDLQDALKKYRAGQ